MTNIKQTMRAAVLNGHGGFEQLQLLDDYPVPLLTKNDVLIKVSAAALNNTDINTRIGWYAKKQNNNDDATWSGQAVNFPRIQGIDVCGHIVAVGNHIDKKRIGERVLVEPCLWHYKSKKLKQAYFVGSECDGGFAQYIAIDSSHTYQIKSHLSDVELASFPCAYATAENMITRANVQANDIVLITGASGGVGSAAVQLAKRRGAQVIAITSDDKQKKLKQLGADVTYNRDDDLEKTLGENSVSVVIDLVAGVKWPQFLTLLKPNGRYAVAGAIGGAMVELDVRQLYLKDLTFFGCTRLASGIFKNLIGYIEKEEIKPLVDKVLPLSDIVKAQKLFLQKKYIGKIVLKC